MQKNFICWFIMICSISAYQIKGLGKGSRVLDFLALGIIIFLILLYATYQGRNQIKENFKYPILFLFISVAISVFMADKFHNQDASLTLYEQRALYFYLFYFLLHFLTPEPKKLENMILGLGFLFCIIYIIQKVLYPVLITDSMVFFDRGTLRIFMPGASIMVFSYFIAFQKIFEKFTWFSFSIIILSLSVSLLLAGRQLILSLVLISYVNILINKRIKNRLALFALFVVVISVLGFLMKDTINDLITLTLKHSQEGANYIRIKAANYFLFHFQKNHLTYFLGNGVPTERSAYGVSMLKLSTSYGFYLSDLGLISVYFKFGLIFAITVIIVLIKILFFKIDTRIIYIKNYLVSIVITIITTGLIFEEKGGIATLCIMFYLIDYYKNLTITNIVIENKNEKLI